MPPADIEPAAYSFGPDVVKSEEELRGPLKGRTSFVKMMEYLGPPFMRNVTTYEALRIVVTQGILLPNP
jgi:hypothetical protein